MFWVTDSRRALVKGLEETFEETLLMVLRVQSSQN